MRKVRYGEYKGNLDVERHKKESDRYLNKLEAEIDKEYKELVSKPLAWNERHKARAFLFRSRDKYLNEKPR